MRKIDGRGKKYIAILLVLLMMLLSGCSSKQEEIPQIRIPVITQAPENGSYVPAQNYGNPSAQNNVVQGSMQQASAALTIGYVAAPGSELHPLRGNSKDLNSINHLVFESVVELDGNQQPVPLLADRWEFNGLEWTFYLREGVVFHDGSPMTAHDVIASWEDILLNESVSPYAARVSYIQEMTAIDDHTLRVVGRDTGYMTLYSMTFPVVQRYSLDSTLPRGTGPYWYIRYDSYTMLRLERNPLWWKRQPYIDSINCIRYDETVDALTDISTGKLDAIATREACGALSRQLSDRTTLDYSTVTWECLVPNLTTSLLSDLTLRKAIMYAIDRTTLADTIYLGMAQESEVPVVPGTWLYETQSTQYNYNPERAYQMLIDSGWHDSDGDGILDRVKEGMWQDLEITIVTYNEPGISIRQEAVKQLVEQLGRVGIRVNVSVKSKSGVKTLFKDDAFDLALVGFNLSEMPDLAFLLETDANGNCSEYSSQEMDKLLEEARQAKDADEMKRKISDIQMKVVSDLPVMGLFFRTGVLISTENLDGLTGIRETHVLRGLEFCQID